ncbi:MAG: murein transglycosylase [Rhodospirillaceae bacterium]|nr:murein transglycosylase [Rhodospirillaceae bacterium]|tara:strand:- start:667 stop:1824 length:1158 start_codon:yes stop_codon:yes gene_type:complete
MKAWLICSHCVVVLLALVACTKPPLESEIFLSVTSFAELAGWRDDQHSIALEAFRRSCAKPLISKAPIVVLRSDWSLPCAATANIPRDDDTAARSFFETWFTPFSVSASAGTDGLFTGYFEAELRGSRQKDDRYRYPIYRLPDDHVSVDLGRFDRSLEGRHVVGQIDDGILRPYHTRRAIDSGALSQRGLELLWLDNVIDAFVLHVQGSGRVILPDGTVVRVGFAGHNGLAYRSIGRALIQRGALKRGKANWGDIRRWIEANPTDAMALLAVNRRYIFFRELKGEGPIGGAGVALTPRRSLAVDRRLLPYGAPVWLDTSWPNDPERPLRRLMVAQDTGAAIRGAVRGDFFWGYGPKALAFAGKMKSRGRYYLLLPRDAAKRRVGS